MEKLGISFINDTMVTTRRYLKEQPGVADVFAGASWKATPTS